MGKTVFLDRDGVINRDSPNFIKNWGEFEFLPGSLEAIRNLTLNGFSIYIITNQSIINRGLATLGDLCYIHAMMLKAIESQGGRITDIFYCPHRPDEGCQCRKPQPGLIRQAQYKYDLDPAAACMVGDTITDIECAYNAGCRSAVLVRSRYGNECEAALTKRGIKAEIAETFYDAAAWIISWL